MNGKFERCMLPAGTGLQEHQHTCMRPARPPWPVTPAPAGGAAGRRPMLAMTMSASSPVAEQDELTDTP